MKVYLKKVFNARFFWTHLAKIELKNKFRRSKLGILWTFISPLCMTGIMSVVFGTVFHQDIVTYAPYILSGIIFWDLVNSSFVGGSMVIIGSESYIRQFNHPISIYMLKSAVVCTTSFLIELIALALWVLAISPQNLLIGIVTLPLTVVLFFTFAFSGAVIGSYTNTRYRDYPQMMPIILQTLWYLSPVFFQESMFKSNELLYTWFNINPLTHILQLLRAPFLYGQYPTATNYIVSIIFVGFFACLAYRIDKKNNSDIIFYI